MTPNIIEIIFPMEKTESSKSPIISRKMRLSLIPPAFLCLTISATKLTSANRTRRSMNKLSKLTYDTSTVYEN